jgi:hypothetical protein
MSDELINNIMYLIDSKKGDVGRLNYILSVLQDGKPLYNSDRKYLDSLLSTHMRSLKERSGEQKSVEELKVELARVKERLEKIEKRGYKKHIGRKAVFFFITFFFGWHAVMTLINEKFIHDVQDINPYIFPLYYIERITPVQYIDNLSQLGFSISKIVLLVWGVMIFTWIILGFAYLIKFIRSRYNPNR